MEFGENIEVGIGSGVGGEDDAGESFPLENKIQWESGTVIGMISQNLTDNYGSRLVR